MRRIPDLIICFILLVSCIVIHFFSKLFQSIILLNVRINEGNDRTLADFINTQPSYGWLLKLVINCIGYSFVVVPAIFIHKYTKQINYLEGGEKSPIYNIVKLCITGSMSNNEKVEPIHKNTPSKMSTPKELCLLGYCFVGLMAFYLTWGVLQEKIMTQEYEDSEGKRSRFTDSQFLVLINRFLAFITSGICLMLKNDVRHRAPLYKYSFASFSNIMSAWFQYEALKFVSFPTQVLAKSFKIIPVMVMGKIISRNKYEQYEYLTAVMISIGMLFFMFGSSDDKTTSVTTMTGIFLLSMYLVTDSFTSNWQQDLFKSYGMSSIQMMCGISFFSTLLTSASLSVQGGLMEPLNFASQHPKFMMDCIIISICSAFGQLFIYYTISVFGSVTFTIIMTVRQAVAILLSCIIYHHDISFLGIAGIVIVFLAIFMRYYCNQRIKTLRKAKSESIKLPV